MHYNCLSRLSAPLIPCTPFIVLFIGRTGSSFFCDALHQHLWIQSLPEEMERLRVAGKESQTQWLTDFYMHNSRPALARGFKTKLWDVLDLPYFASFLINNNIRVIRLTRANTLRAAISTIRSHELHKRIGFWNSTDPTVRLAPTQLDFTQLDELIRNRERAHKQLSEFLATTDPRHILSISHEELTCNFQNTMR